MEQSFNESLVSVIIPTYERPSKTLRAVKSVISQTYKNYEIIVIDDGSSQESFNLLKKNLSDLEIQLLRIERSNQPGIVRNVGAKMAKGKWLAFLDSDDQWHPDKLSLQIDVVNSLNVKAIATIGSIVNTHSNGDLLISNAPKIVTHLQLLRRNWIITSSVLIERDLYEQVGGMAEAYSVRGAEDYATWLKISSRVDWYVIKQPLVLYSDNSSDSIRFSEPQKQNYAISLGWIDYLNWRYANGKSKGLLLKVALKLAPFIIWVSR